MAITDVPAKQAVIAPSALSLIYPQELQATAGQFIELNNRVLERLSDGERQGSASTPAPAGIGTQPTASTSPTTSCCQACCS